MATAHDLSSTPVQKGIYQTSPLKTALVPLASARGSDYRTFIPGESQDLWSYRTLQKMDVTNQSLAKVITSIAAVLLHY